MRKLTLILLCALLALCTAAFAEDEDISLEDILSGADPDVVFDTFIPAPQDDANAQEAVSEADSIYEKDGSILITITATGDFTVGGDTRKSSNIWYTELKKHDGDYQFAMKNIREVLLADDLTIVNF